MLGFGTNSSPKVLCSLVNLKTNRTPENTVVTDKMDGGQRAAPSDGLPKRTLVTE